MLTLNPLSPFPSWEIAKIDLILSHFPMHFSAHNSELHCWAVAHTPMSSDSRSVNISVPPGIQTYSGTRDTALYLPSKPAALQSG